MVKDKPNRKKYKFHKGTDKFLNELEKRLCEHFEAKLCIVEGFKVWETFGGLTIEIKSVTLKFERERW